MAQIPLHISPLALVKLKCMQLYVKRAQVTLSFKFQLTKWCILALWFLKAVRAVRGSSQAVAAQLL